MTAHRVGIIPWRFREKEVELLFVTSQTRGRWVLPKGKMKAGEHHHDTCHREGFEEAGVRGIVLEDYPFTVAIGRQTGATIQTMPVTFYPYLVAEFVDSWPEKTSRRRNWFTFAEALDIADPDDYRVLVRQFDALLPWILDAAKELEVKANAAASKVIKARGKAAGSKRGKAR